MVRYELSRWLAYRQIQHEKMYLYVWVLPGVIASLFTGIFFILPVRPSITGADGILAAITQILALLPGFFIASLAAVATFQRPEMDVEMPEPAPKLQFRFDGEWHSFDLTRRMFLSYLFSYLSITSLLLVSFCLGANLLSASFLELFSSENLGYYADTIKNISVNLFILFVFYWCASIFITTLHGIYFLVERMHQPN